MSPDFEWILCQSEQNWSPYLNEWKRLTLLGSFPNNPDWEKMHFNGMHTNSSYESLVAAVELEEECLKERVTAKSQSTSNIFPEKSKTKNKNGSKKRMEAPKSRESGNEGGSFKNKKVSCGKKLKKGCKGNAKCHKHGKLDHFAHDCILVKKVHYFNSAICL